MDGAPDVEDATPLARARIADLRAAADGDDTTLLRLCTAELAALAAYQGRVERMRDEAVQRLRAEGMPMTRISLLAKVSDSYLSRRLRRPGR